MKNSSLIFDYIKRARLRLSAVDALFQREAWADVVRESQEVVELSLKALLRAGNIEVPRIHEVSQALLEHVERLPAQTKEHVEKLSQISRTLRRDRELAFYGSEDLTPSEFYTKADAHEALTSAYYVVEVVERGVL